jgi:membrane associated rhomboid family serine protease
MRARASAALGLLAVGFFLVGGANVWLDDGAALAWYELLPLLPVRLFVHTNVTHLVGNLLVLALAGGMVENREGTRRLLTLFFVCGLLGGLVESVVVNANFAGMSPATYGLAAYWLVTSEFARRFCVRDTVRPIATVAVVLGLEFIFLESDVAVFSHITGALSGMFASLTGNGGRPRLRPMTMRDLGPVIEIIEEHDEDDAEEAQQSIAAKQAQGLYVLVAGPQIIGVTGAHPDEHTQGIAWLSWTYLRKNVQAQGAGRYMVEQMLTKLQNKKVRKVFIATSDYTEDGVDIYADAKRFYVSLGAELDLVQNDYHEMGEARYIYGLEIAQGNEPGVVPFDDDESPSLHFVGLDPAPESKGGWIVSWKEALSPPMDAAGSDSDSDSDGEEDEDGEPEKASQEPQGVSLESLVQEARTSGTRALFVALPAPLAKTVDATLRGLGFSLDGELKDYYGPGVHEQHWSVTLA